MLPPLPPVPWLAPFPRRLFTAAGVDNRHLAGRVNLASRPLCDEFVRTLGIRPNELVLDCFPGPGQLTRSLLSGGRQGNEATESRNWSRRAKYPSWTPPSWNVEPGPEMPRPAQVVAVEPSHGLLTKAFGSARKRSRLDIPIPLDVCESDSQLFLSHANAYVWSTLPDILSQISAPASPWEEQPHITVVAQIPNSAMGAQLLSQWIGSAAGGSDGRHWIWKWGRVRLAVLVEKNLYDRVMASAGENIYGRLSVLADALFERRPLAPFHHVANVDRLSQRTEPSGPHTIVRSDDFYPRASSTSRSPFLGICLTPRVHSVVKGPAKSSWDYVLRNCFIRGTAPISEGMMTLGFGAANLVPKLASERYAGHLVDPKTPTKDLEPEQWLRVVDVFDKWAFKPVDLILHDPAEMSRQLASD